MEIGSKLKHARNEKGLTQEQSAELLGVSRQTISNWENSKSYPDIISVIKMSDVYSVSLDHLLKEENTMKQTYHAFLEESTNTVKAKRDLGKTILLSAYFITWMTAMIVFWLTKGPMTPALDVIFRWMLLPLLLLTATVTVAKQNYWGEGNWLCVAGAALTFLTVPYTEYAVQEELVTFAFRFPNLPYMAAGVVIALCGLLIGGAWRKKASAKEN